VNALEDIMARRIQNHWVTYITMKRYREEEELSMLTMQE
jgi:hypothetical protein